MSYEQFDLVCAACDAELPCGVVNDPERPNLCPTCERAGVYKKCKCGHAYTRETWGALDYAGEQPAEDGEVLELRNCVCGSTLAIVLVEGVGP